MGQRQVSRITISLAVAVTLFAGWVCSASGGPVNYLSQDRSIEARLDEEYKQPKGPSISLHDIETATAPNAGPFDASATAVIPAPPFEAASGETIASQRSTLGNEGIKVAGFYSGFTATEGGSYTFRSHADVMFQLTGEVDYALSYSLEVPFFTAGRSSKLSLVRVDDPSVAVFDEVLDFTGSVGDNAASIGSRKGILTPGTYRFEFLHVAGTDVFSNGNYDVMLGLTSSNHGGPHPIPLPPGAWAAIAAIGGFLVILKIGRLTGQSWTSETFL